MIKVISIIFLGLLISFARGSDTLTIKGKLIFVDTTKCNSSSVAPIGMEKLLLIEVYGGWDGCKKNIVAKWHTACDCKLVLNKSYSFALVVTHRALDSDSNNKNSKLDMCDDYVLKQPANFFFELLSIDGYINDGYFGRCKMIKLRSKSPLQH